MYIYMYIYTRTLRYVLIDSVEPFDRAFIIRFFEATRRTEENAPTNYRPLSNSIWIYKPSPYIERSDAKCLIDPADLYLPTVYRVQYTGEGRGERISVRRGSHEESLKIWKGTYPRLAGLHIHHGCTLMASTDTNRQPRFYLYILWHRLRIMMPLRPCLHR